MAITYKRLTEQADLLELERLQENIWSKDSVIPLHMTLTLHKFGGLFLGAYDGDDMIGFQYSFAGFMEEEPILCSHMLGFLPEYRRHGLGVIMKWMQREEALKMGYRKISWTYDPLETVNANLNLAKLGGIVRRYVPNCYGELNDEMNRGLPTDRFIVEWFIDSKRVERYQVEQQTPSMRKSEPILSCRLDEQGLPVPVEARFDIDADTLVLPVPAHFQQVKRASFAHAVQWRTVTGQLFPHYFNLGYVVCGVERDEKEPIVRYLLSKGPLSELLG